MTLAATEERLLEIGRITRPHGVRGELKVQLHWQQSEALSQVDQVLVRHEERPDRWLAVVGARPANRFVLLRLEGIETMDAAAELRGARLLVAREALPALAEDEYYLADVVGCRVRCHEAELGVVVEVRSYATVDVLVVETKDGRRLEQPVVDHWIQSVDPGAGVVVLASTDGLIE